MRRYDIFTGLVRLDALDLYAQQHVLLEAVLLPVVHAKVCAVERAAGVGSANLLLEHGVQETLEGIDGERYRLRDAVKGQFARNSLRGTVCEFNKFSLE